MAASVRQRKRPASRGADHDGTSYSAPPAAPPALSISATSQSGSGGSGRADLLPPATLLDAWVPNFGRAFAALAAARVVGTLYYDMISDCDETFNYWEPTHYLLYGTGLQTWEYSPQYALRSYAYVGLHAAVGVAVGGGWGVDKITVFHRTRLVLAMLCALCEAVLYRGVLVRLGKRTALFTLLALLASAGMLHAAPAYLPSSFTMCGLMLAWGFWLAGSAAAAVAATVAALALGWPFAVVAVVPMGIHMLATERWARLVAVGAASVAAVLGASALVDHHFYHAWLIAAWNIIKYNALGVGGGGQGADLYGTEPANFYAANLFLNFNLLALLAAASPLALLVLGLAACSRSRRAVASAERRPPTPAKRGRDIAPPLGWTAATLAPLYLWFGLMSARPHKEERFMFVVYPLVAVAAGVTLNMVDAAMSALLRQLLHLGSSGATPPASARRGHAISITVRGVLIGAVLAAAAVVSGARVRALVDGYSAPSMR
jgi:alpha-1,2-mannosyltransferase